MVLWFERGKVIGGNGHLRNRGFRFSPLLCSCWHPFTKELAVLQMWPHHLSETPDDDTSDKVFMSCLVSD